MLSGEQIGAIVEHFIEPAVHIHLARLKDVKRHPNDILTSYFMAELSLQRGPLAEVFGSMGSLDQWLNMAEDTTVITAKKHEVPKSGGDEMLARMWHDGHVAELIGEGVLPKLPEGYFYAMPLELIANAITAHSKGYIAFGSGKRGDGKLLAAKEKRYLLHEYQPDSHVPYTSLTDELPANVSILEAGYSVTNGEGGFKIYVRQNSIVTIAAMFEALRESPEFKEFRHMSPDDVEYNSTGIVIAHELGEVELAKEGEIPDNLMERDKAAEAYARQFLEENKFPMAYYKLFHTLRVTPDDENRNVSAEVLRSL